MGEPVAGRPASRGQAVLWGTLGVLLVLAIIAVMLVVARTTRTSVPAGAPTVVEPGITSAGSQLLQLDPQPAPLATAPGMSLEDQTGHPMTLEQFRGKSVVLSFNDDRCKDLCSLLGEDVVAADDDLGAATSKVEFVSVNANPYFPRPTDVRQWTDDHGLGHEPNWVFATGDAATLAEVAADYSVPIQLRPKDKSVIHGSELFFIDPSGRVAALGQFGAESASTALFGHVMAQAAVDLLPDSGSIRVSGPSPSTVPVGRTTGAALGSVAPAFVLPDLADPGRSVGLAQHHGRLTVVNFWSSTCTACTAEMPAIEHVHRDLGSTVDVVGVDVSDTAGPALALARRAGVTYPLAADAHGSTAGDYRVSGLPFTAVVGADGTVLVRRPGALTAEELEYTVQTLANS